MTQPAVTVTLILPALNSTVTCDPGAIHNDPSAPNRSVAPTPSGVTICAPLGIDAPLTAEAPFTDIALLSRVVSTPMI